MDLARLKTWRRRLKALNGQSFPLCGERTAQRPTREHREREVR
jgi:hypothetical protein